MAISSDRVLTVDAEISVPGFEHGCRASSFTIAWGINLIPYANIVLPLNYSNNKLGVYRSLDFSAYALNKTYDILEKLKEGDDAANSVLFVVTVYEMVEGEEVQISEIRLEGWKVTNVKLQPQNRRSPGGVEVTIEHPMCVLKSTPGFFYVGGMDFEKLAKEITGNGIISIADSTIDKLKEAIDEQASKTGGKRWNIEKADSVYTHKLSDFIDDDLGLPYIDSPYINWGNADKDALTEACKVSIASSFFNLRESVPYKALTALGELLGFYCKIAYDDERAKLRKYDPWQNRNSPFVIDKEHVFETRITPDTRPICGIRLTSSGMDNTIVSTLSSFRPLDAATNESLDTMFYYSNKGSVINTTTPAFVGKMLGRAAVIASNPATSSNVSTTSNDNIVPRDRVEDPADSLNVTGASNTAALTILDDVHNVTAESLFCMMYKSNYRLDVTCVLLELAFPEIGSFATVSSGTGGYSLAGMVTGITIQGSSAGGSCQYTINMAYVGDPPKIGENIPMNKIWK